MNAYTDEHSTAVAYVNAFLDNAPPHWETITRSERDALVALVQHVINDVIDDQPL